MKKTANLCVRVDPTIKEQAEDIFQKLGISFSTAMNMFLKQVILCNGMPFEISIPKEESRYIKIPEEELKNIFVGYSNRPNEDTINALLELNEMKSNKKKYKRYSSFSDLLGNIMTTH